MSEWVEHEKDKDKKKKVKIYLKKNKTKHSVILPSPYRRSLLLVKINCT